MNMLKNNTRFVCFFLLNFFLWGGGAIPILHYNYFFISVLLVSMRCSFPFFCDVNMLTQNNLFDVNNSFKIMAKIYKWLINLSQKYSVFFVFFGINLELRLKIILHCCYTMLVCTSQPATGRCWPTRDADCSCGTSCSWLLMKHFSLQCAFSHGGHLFAAVHGNVIQVYSSVTFENVANLKGHNGKVSNFFDQTDHWVQWIRHKEM